MHHHPTSKVVTKKTKPNGFAMFMQDLRDRYREEGQRVPSMAEMVNIANPLWSNLSQQDKSYFNQRAKVASKSGISMAKVVADTRLDCIGEPIADRVDEKGQLEERRKSERHFTRARFGAGKSAAKCRFFFIDFQFLCKVEKSNYIPCEVSAIEYSIECGIVRTWHKFIDPGKIPTGYRYEAQNRSEQVHSVPVDKFELAESDYGLILEELQQFINPHRENEFPPLFARKEEAEMVESCCRWLAERTDTDHELFKVYVLEYLLIDLSGHISDISPSPHEAKDMLTSSAFDYEPGTNCVWHEAREIRHCSLGMVNRHAYIFSDHLCPKYNVSMGPTHLPLVKESQQHTVLSPGPQESDFVFPSRDVRYFPSQQQSNPSRSYKYEIEDNESLASFATDTTNYGYPTSHQQAVKPVSSPKHATKIGRGRARNKTPNIPGNLNPPAVGVASSTFATVDETVRDCDSEICGTEVAFNALNLGSSADRTVEQSPHLNTATAPPNEHPLPRYTPTPQSSSYPDNFYTAYPLPPSAQLPAPSPISPPANYLSDPDTPYQQHISQLPNPATAPPYNAPTALNYTVPSSTSSATANPPVNTYQQQLPPNIRSTVPSIPNVPPLPTQPQPQYNSFGAPYAPPVPPVAPQPASYQYSQYQAPPNPQYAYPYQQATYNHSYNPNAYAHPQQILQTQFPPTSSYNQGATYPAFQPSQQSFSTAAVPATVQHPHTPIPPSNPYLQNYGTQPTNPQTIAQYPQSHVTQAHPQQMESHIPKQTPPPQNGFYQNPQQILHQGEPAYAPSQIPPSTYPPQSA